MASHRNDDGKELALSADKAAVDHQEIMAVPTDEQMTPWQCMVANPKMIMWTLYANSTSAQRPLGFLPISLTLKQSVR